MLGKTHALSGAAAGAVACAALGASLPVTAVVVPIMAGAAYLPDLDSPGSTVSRSLGPITGAVSRGIMGLSKGIVHITRGPKDTVKGAHRTFTHSLIGFAAFGAVAWAAAKFGDVYLGGYYVTAVILAFLMSMGAMALTKNTLVSSLIALAMGTAIVFFNIAIDPIIVGAIVAGGMIIHTLGDSVTKSGAPWLGGIRIGGKAWRSFHLVPKPLRITTGTPAESVYFWAFVIITIAALAYPILTQYALI